MRSGITLACPTFFATAPASKFNYADDWFSRVTQTVPKSVSSSALAILSFYRAPPIAVVIGHPWTDALNNPLATNHGEPWRSTGSAPRSNR
jgi:hypothetical protein